MPRRPRPAALALTAALAAAAPAAAGPPAGDAKVDELSIRRHLSYTMFRSEGRTRGVAERILRYWGAGTRYSENARGEWVVANRGGMMVNGRAYDAPPGDPIKVVMASDGTWVASTPEVFIHAGTRIEDPATVARVHADVYAFQTMALGNASPSSSPLRAGPRRPERTRGFRVPRAMTVDRFEMADAANPEVAAALASETERRLDVTVDTEAPFPRRVLVTRNPDDPIHRRAGFPPRFFVGLHAVEFQILMSERMASAPRVEVVQADGTRTPAALQADQNPLYFFRWFPFASPEGNGPARLEILGDTQNTPPTFGADEAGNVIQPVADFSVFEQGLVVDTMGPELKRIDPGQPGAFRMVPGENEVLAKHEFPKSILAFVDDYDRPADPGGSGPQSTEDASGVHFRRIGDGSDAIELKLFKPDGSEIPGTLSSRINALELFLPDVYDPATGVFPDVDADGVADPLEGDYRVQVNLVDEVGNTSMITLPFGADVTPIGRRSLTVSVRPILAGPVPGPDDPLPDEGDVHVRRLDGVEIRSPDPDFSFARSNVKIQSLAAGRFTVPVDLVGEQVRDDDVITFTIARDQDGDGQDDFENPAPGQFLPPGAVDPRAGRNDGLYRVVIEAVDRAGNRSTITRDLNLDTTPPAIGMAFPEEGGEFFAPLRMVEVRLTDPQAASGSEGSGVRLVSSQVSLRFLGNDQTPAQDIRGIPFLHTPNPDDPNQPDFNPVDTDHRLLLELVDEDGQVQALPADGSFDGVYQMDVIVRDQAGNEAMGTTTFSYASEEPTTDTTDDGMAPLPRPPPLELPVMLALTRP